MQCSPLYQPNSLLVPINSTRLARSLGLGVHYPDTRGTVYDRVFVLFHFCALLGPVYMEVGNPW